jgi:hypothetical protein
MRVLVIGLIAAGLSACGSIKPATVTSANERTVVIRAITSDLKAALQLADTECAKHGRVARMAGKIPDSVDILYDCVN